LEDCPVDRVEDSVGPVVGGCGSAWAGGGCSGGGVLDNNWGISGKSGASATVDKDVAAVARLEPIELFQVLPEKPLESDSRGKADFD
jgi:hypothetical protein